MDVLARAFADNPVNVAVIGITHAHRVRCNAAGMRALLPVAIQHGRVFAAHRNGRLAGCLIASPPLVHPLPPPSIVARLRVRLCQGKRVTQRWAGVFHTLDVLHPRQPHWYLGSLGVAPESQRQGLGKALLARFLECADADADPCYLETDRSENLAFYEQRGFRNVGEVDVHGATAWRMWRPAAGAPALD